MSSVQTLPSSHLRTVAPGMQWPPKHASVTVQMSPSSHAAELTPCWQPLVGTHESSVHTLLSSHSEASPAPWWQPLLASQESSVQAMPSSQSMAVPTQVAFAH